MDSVFVVKKDEKIPAGGILDRAVRQQRVWDQPLPSFSHSILRYPLIRRPPCDPHALCKGFKTSDIYGGGTMQPLRRLASLRWL